jgi:hypothetical protein
VLIAGAGLQLVCACYQRSCWQQQEGLLAGCWQTLLTLTCDALLQERQPCRCELMLLLLLLLPLLRSLVWGAALLLLRRLMVGRWTLQSQRLLMLLLQPVLALLQLKARSEQASEPG